MTMMDASCRAAAQAMQSHGLQSGPQEAMVDLLADLDLLGHRPCRRSCLRND